MKLGATNSKGFKQAAVAFGLLFEKDMIRRGGIDGGSFLLPEMRKRGSRLRRCRRFVWIDPRDKEVVRGDKLPERVRLICHECVQRVLLKSSMFIKEMSKRGIFGTEFAELLRRESDRKVSH